MVNVCQKCGARGYTELLIHCSRCETYAEHRYCLDIFPKDSEIKVNLLCEQCSARGATILSFDKTQRSGSKKGNPCLSSTDKKQKEVENEFYLCTKNKYLYKRKGVENDVWSSSKTTKDRKEVENNGCSSRKIQKFERSRRRCILSDDEISDDEARSVRIDHSVFGKTTLDLNEPLLSSASKSKTIVHDQMNERAYQSCESDRNINALRHKRRLILPDGDELEDEALANVIDYKIQNKRTFALLPSVDEGDIIFVSTPSDIVHHEVNNKSQIVSSAVSEPRAVAQTGEFSAQPNMPCHQTYTAQSFYTPARPIFHHVWRGCFDICNEEYGPVLAHLSSRACNKVLYGTTLLTPVLHMEKLSRLDAWPNSFKTSPPTDDNIALYFFPSDDRSEPLIDQLLDDIISKDLMLKVTFNDAELLVYSSISLPEHYHRFDGKYYLWGVFRTRQGLVSSTVSYCRSKPSQQAEQQRGSFCSKPASCCSELNQLREEKQATVPSTPEKCCSELNQQTRDKQENGDMKHAEEMENLRSHSQNSSDIVQHTDAGALSHSLEILHREQVPAPSLFAKCHSKLNELVKEKQIMLTLMDGLDEIEEGEIPDDSGEEREEGEIHDEAPFPVLTNRDISSTVACLELFPLRNEDMAITARGVNNGLDLELGLGRSASDDGKNRECKAKTECVSQVYFDSAIY